MLRSPFHPGHFLRQLLEEHEISQAKLARHLHVPSAAINQICNERRAISPSLAIKLAMALSYLTGILA